MGLRLFAPAPVPVWTWSLTEGMHRDGEPAEVGTLDARGVLDFIAAHPTPAIFHLKDFHEPLRESAEIRRRLRDIYESCRDRRKFVVITSPVRFIPEELERSLMFLELRPPDLVELVAFLREEARRYPATTSSTSSRARCWGSPSTKRATPCAAPWPPPDNWGRNRCPPCSKRSACWSTAAA